MLVGYCLVLISHDMLLVCSLSACLPDCFDFACLDVLAGMYSGCPLCSALFATGLGELVPDRTRLEYEGLACRGLDWRVVAWLVIWLGLAWLGFQPALRLSGNGCFVGEACLDSSCLVLSCLALASPDLTGIPEMTNMNPRQPRTGTQRGSSVGKNSQLVLP